LILISHRGNLQGPNKSRENSTSQIDLVLSLGLDCEIDVWIINKEIFLGHDSPMEMVSLEWLIERSSRLWIHCKNLDSLEFFVNSSLSLNYFWHQNDDYTLTSRGFIWAFPGKPLSSSSILVLPELEMDTSRDYLEFNQCSFIGICSDYVQKIKVRIF
jgi:hypothetical protein